MISSWENEDFTQALKVYLFTYEKTKTQPFYALSQKSLSTGYFKPLLQVSLEKSDMFSYPVYGVPEGLESLEPIFYVKDKLNLFFYRYMLQVTLN